MADTTAVATITDKWDDGQRVHVLASVAIGASPLTYPTGGIPMDLLTATILLDSRPGFLPLPGISSQPIRVEVKGIAGFTYAYDRTNKKLIIRASAAITPAGTIAVTEGAVTVVGGGIGEAIGINPDSNAGVLSKAAATNRTIPRATFLGSATTAAFTGTAVTAAALAELANASAIPAGVSGDTIQLYAIFKKL